MMSMTMSEFKLSHPFVEVRNGAVDKFCFDIEQGTDDGKLRKVNKVHKDLLDSLLLLHVLPALQKAASCVSTGVASALFPIFTHLAPRSSDAGLLQISETGAAADVMACGLWAHDATPLLEWASIISPESETHSRDSVPGAHQTVDFRAYGEGKQNFTVLVADKNKAGFVWETETDENSVLYRLSEYACGAAIANMQGGRYKPVYMLVLADGAWACAMLYPQGFLLVDEDRKICSASFTQFLECTKRKWCLENPHEKYPDLSDNEMAEKLKEYQKRLDETRVTMGNHSMDMAVPPNRRLLVGEIVFDNLTYSWTKFPIPRHYWFSLPDYVLLSGLLRVLFGDRVLQWTKQTLEALSKARDDELAALDVLFDF